MATKVIVSFEVDNAGAVTKIQQVKKELGDVPQSTAKASSGLKDLQKTLAAVGIAFGAVQIKNFIADSVRLAAEEEQVMTRLAATLNTLGVSYSGVSSELSKMFKGIQETTRFSDDQAAAAFQKLLVITGDYNSAIKLLGPVMDMAIGGTMDLESAATITGKAVAGNIGVLSRYGIVLDEATRKQLEHASAAERTSIIAEALNKRFGGQAKADIASYGGQVAQLRNQWEELKEALGGVILQSLDLSKINTTVRAIADVMPEIISGVKILAPILATMWAVERIDKFSRFLDGLPGKFRLANTAALDLKFTVAAIVGIGLSEWFDSWNRTLEGPSARAIGAFQRAVKDAGMSVDGLLASFPEAKDKTEAWALAFERFIADTKDGKEAAGQWVRVAALYNAEIGKAADITVTAGEAAETTTKAVEDLDKSFLSAGDAGKRYFDIIIDGVNEANTQFLTASDNARNLLRVISPDQPMPSVFDPDEPGGLAGQAENTFDFIGGAFSDLLGKGFMGELDSFSDLWDEIWQDLAKSMTQIIGDAFVDALENGWGRLSGTFEEMSTGTRIGGALAGLGMVFSATQQGGGWGSILQGMMGGAITGAMWASPAGGIGAGVGAVIGAVVGGLIAALGSQAQEDPETFVRNLGIDTGTIMTRGHQGYTDELQALWVTQQQQIMRSYISSYRAVLRLFEDQSLFDLIGATPTFDTAGWMGMGADQLATWLQEEFWPSAFMNMFQEAISAGLEGLGVTSGTLDQLWDELEALPGEDRMGALTTYISSLVDLSHLVADMDWNAIMDVVGADSMTAFMTGIDEIAGTIDGLMMALDDMTLLERAEQAQQIEQLIVQVRQAEIQYLQQLQSLQTSINQSIASMLEQFQIGDMGPGAQQAYYQQRIAEIMAILAGGSVSSPEQLQQLMADLQRYIQALAQGLGDQLFQPMDIMGWGETWADYLSGVLEQAQGYSDAYFEEFRDEIRAANDELIEAIRDLIEALTGNRTEGVGGLIQAPGQGESAYYQPPGGGQPQVNVYLEGSMSALRPFVRAEIRDSLRGRPRGIN